MELIRKKRRGAINTKQLEFLDKYKRKKYFLKVYCTLGVDIVLYEYLLHSRSIYYTPGLDIVLQEHIL